MGIWDPFGYKQVAQLVTAHDGWVTCVRSLGPNTGYLATSGADMLIKIWDISSFRIVRRLKQETSGATSLEVLSNGYLASGAYDSTVTIWNLNTASKVYSNKTPGNPQIISIKEINNQTLAVVSWSSTIYYLNLISYAWTSTGLSTSGWSLSGLTQVRNKSVLATTWNNNMVLVNKTTYQPITTFTTSMSIYPIEYFCNLKEFVNFKYIKFRNHKIKIAIF